MNELDPQLRRLMDAMPELAPPDALAGRIVRAGGRRMRRLVAAGAAAVLVLACVAMVGLWPGEPATPDPAPVAVATGPASDALADVRALDHALQAAYERNASDEELAPLWAARARLLGPSAVPADI